MTELLRLIRTEHIKAADVDQVEVGTNHNLPNPLIHHCPKDALQAKFSTCVVVNTFSIWRKQL